MGRVTVTTTNEGWIRSVSPGFLALIGQQVEDLAGINLVDLVHPHDAALARALLGDAGVPDFRPTQDLRLFLADSSWSERQVSVRTADDGRRILEIEATAATGTAPIDVAANSAAAPTSAPPSAQTAQAPTTTPEPTPADVKATDPQAADAKTAWTERVRQLAPGDVSVLRLLTICGVVLFAFLVRTWDLSSLPTGFHGDEGVTGLEAERILSDGSIGVYTGSALGQPTGPFYLDAVTVGMFGNTIWATRILSALAGTLAVFATYRIVERRYDHRTGIACALALATMTWSIHFSRIAFGVAWWPLVVLLAVAAIDQAMTDQTRRSWFIAGALSVLGVYVYNSHWSFGPAVVVAVVLWFVSMLVGRKHIRFDGLAFGVLGALIVGLPMGKFILDNEGFFNHFNQISRRSSPEWIEAGLGSKISMYIDWYWETWRTLAVTPVFDGTDASGINKPIPLAFAAAALVGLVDIARRRRSLFAAIVVVTLVALPATTTLTSLAIARRTYALAPLVAILAGFGAIALIDLARRTSTNRRAGLSAGAALLVVALLAGVFPYFTAFRNNPGQRGVFTHELTTAVEAIQLAERDGPVYVNWYSPRQDFRYPTLEFLLDDTPGESRAPVGTEFMPDLDLALSHDIDGRDQLFVLIGPYTDELDRLRNANPTGTIVAQRVEPLIIVYKVPSP